jgi:diguanylate cyclase (GGDEF)-like protein
MGSRGRQEVEDLQARLQGALRREADLKARLQDLEATDPLTRLLNLDAYYDRAAAAMERARRHGTPVTLAVIDLDGFRALNSHHGHEAGNQLLRHVGRVLAGPALSGVDSVARVSADEFSLVMLERGREATGRLGSVLAELQRAEVGPIRCVMASAGLAEYQRDDSPEQLLAKAGVALDRARSLGGGRTALYGDFDMANETRTEAQRDVLVALAGALLERDEYTGDHSESVVEMVADVAQGFGLDPIEVERIKAGARLHDIGKVGIPDQILNKPGPLDDEEWILMRQHSVIGERIVAAIPGLEGVAKIIRHEHENFDGTGYPDGIAGEEIPLGSRIIFACDAYHAMTSDRPYRKAMPHSDAVGELSRCAGSQFDPKVTEKLIGHLYGARQIGAGRLHASAALN